MVESNTILHFLHLISADAFDQSDFEVSNDKYFLIMVHEVKDKKYSISRKDFAGKRPFFIFAWECIIILYIFQCTCLWH